MNKLGLILLIVGLLLGVSGCHLETTRHHTTYYYYDYYPSHNVYYDRSEHVYYYRDEGHWVRNHQLPHHYNIRTSRAHQLRMRHRQPYRDHHWQRYEYYPRKIHEEY